MASRPPPAAEHQVDTAASTSEVPGLLQPTVKTLWEVLLPTAYVDSCRLRLHFFLRLQNF